jgi:quercetin dioxygenase-like cupin family protein
MSKSGKIWGSTEELFKNTNCEVHRIDINKGGFCSKHKHQYKHNIFYVLQGTLLIKVWKNDYELIDTTILQTGKKTDVGPNQYHTFQALEPTIALEIYYSEPISNDIIRETVGGMMKAPEPKKEEKKPEPKKK